MASHAHPGNVTKRFRDACDDALLRRAAVQNAKGTEIDGTVVVGQKLQQPLVVAVREPKQLQHDPIAPAASLEGQRDEVPKVVPREIARDEGVVHLIPERAMARGDLRQELVGDWTPSTAPSEATDASCSMTFWSSRTFPGQWYDPIASHAACVRRRAGARRSMKWCTKGRMSSRRSRSGGTCRCTTRIRKSRSWRKSPCNASCGRSRFVAVMTRACTLMSA